MWNWIAVMQIWVAVMRALIVAMQKPAPTSQKRVGVMFDQAQDDKTSFAALHHNRFALRTSRRARRTSRATAPGRMAANRLGWRRLRFEAAEARIASGAPPTFWRACQDFFGIEP